MAIHKESEIKITVGLDANKIPESIVWDASDGGVSNEEAKALMMGVWDAYVLISGPKTCSWTT